MGPWKDRLSRRSFWLPCSCYALILSSSFSIAGIEFATILMMVTSALHLWRADDAEIAPRWVVLPVLALASAALLSALVNPHPLHTLNEMRGSFRIFLPLAMLPALARVNVRRLLRVFTVCLALAAIYGLIQFDTGADWFRPEGQKHNTPSLMAGTQAFHGMGTFSHYLTYSGFMLINAPLFLALFLNDRSRGRWVWLGGSLMAWLGVITSMGRSGWLGATAGCSVLLLMLPRRWSLPILGTGLVCAILLALSMATGWLHTQLSHPNNSVLVKRMLSVSGTERDRLYLWEAGWLGFRMNPLLGVGMGNERSEYEQHRAVVADRHGGYVFFTAASAGIHNVYLQVAYNLGTVGFAAFLWLIVTVFVWCGRWIRRAKCRNALDLERGLLWGAAAGLVGCLVAGVFENNLFDAEVQNMAVIAVGLALHAGLCVRSAGWGNVTIGVEGREESRH